MIPKIIHYCWLSNEPYPQKIAQCIDSWKKYLPDYEFVKWDFSKINKSDFKWVSDAYDNKRYAFAADYIRVYAVYNYGGIYLDTDVEVLKSFDDLLTFPYFMCYEYKKDQIEAATFGAEKGFKLLKDIVDYYDNSSFIKEDGSFNEIVMPIIFKNMINANYKQIPIKAPNEIVNNQNYICVLPWDFFSPKSAGTGEIKISNRTYSVHHFTATWLPWYALAERRFCHLLGVRNRSIIHRIIQRLKKYYRGNTGPDSKLTEA